MNPKNLKSPFTWEERRPCLQDRVFFVPDYYFSHDSTFFPNWSDTQLFGNENPVCIEYCSGNGDWIVERAQKFPNLNWLAVEIRFDRVRKIWSKIQAAKITNVCIVCGEALTFTKHYLQKATVEDVFVHFPDPWPKRKHEKHRLLSPPFLDELSRVLSSGKKVHFVTDDPHLMEKTIEIFLRHARFKALLPAPFFAPKELDCGTSWFESLWRSKGREIRITQFTCI